MDPISSSPPPPPPSPAPDFSNVQGNSSSTADPCIDKLDNVANTAADFFDKLRDWGKSEASGREVWDAYKDIAKAGGDAFEECVLPEQDFTVY